MTNNSTTVDAVCPVWFLLPTVVTGPPLGLPANALVIRLLLGKPGICSTSEIFILNLALFDLLFCLMVILEYVVFLWHQTTENANLLAWGLNQAGGPLLLCLLALDSYLAVCHPLLFLRHKDPKLRMSLCLVVSAVTAVSCGLVKVSEMYKCFVLLGILLSAIVTISTCNVLILKSLRQSGPGRREVHPVKRRAFKTVLTMLVLVNIHYLPTLTESVLRLTGLSSFSRFSIPACATYASFSMATFLQPLSYLERTKQLPKCGRRRGSAAETKAAATV